MAQNHHQGYGTGNQNGGHQTYGGLGGIQATSSFHSVSSMDSSAEMAKYFPGAQTPSSSPFRHSQGDEDQEIKSMKGPASSKHTGPYAAAGGQQSHHQHGSAPVATPQQQSAPHTSGIPGYSSQIEGLSVSQAIVNDVLVDLQSKMINETQQQYQDDSSGGHLLETLSPIYIRPPNPTIILRSDLQRLRAELASRRPVVVRHVDGKNQFQQNKFSNI